MSNIKINPDALQPKREWVRHKVVEGSNIFRFLPPFGEQANGYPYKRWMVTWGLLDPDSNRLRPYASSITTSEKACPVMEFVKILSEKAEVIGAELKASGATSDAVKERLKSLNKTISNLRPKGSYAWNAVDKAGKLGLLELKSTANKKLKALMSEYINDYNQDPTSVNSTDDDSGIWFNIKRTGTGFDTEYDAEKFQSKTKINGQIAFVDDRSALPDDIAAEWEKNAYDLNSIYQVKTYDELNAILLANMPRIIKECPDALIPGFESTVVATEAVSTTVITKPANAPTGPAITTKFDDEDDLVEASAPAPVTAPAPVAAAALASNSEDLLAMADDILNG